MSDGFCLGVDSTTSHFDYDAELVHGIADAEGIVDGLPPRSPVEEFICGLAVDQDRATVVQIKSDSSDGGLPLSCAVVIGLVCVSLYQVGFVLRPLYASVIE